MFIDWNKIGNDIKKTADNVSGDINNALNTVGNDIKKTSGDINNTLNTVGNDINKTAETIKIGWETEIGKAGEQINQFAANESGKLNDSLNQTGKNITTYFSEEEREKRNRESSLGFYKFLGLSDEDAKRQYESSYSRQRQIGGFFNTLVTNPDKIGENLRDSFTDDNGKFDPLNGTFDVLDSIDVVIGAVPIFGPVYTDVWELASQGFGYILDKIIPQPPTADDINALKNGKKPTKSLSNVPGLGGKSVLSNVKTVANVLAIMFFIILVFYLFFRNKAPKKVL